MGTTVWSPLASGFLTGKHRKGAMEGTRATTVESLGWLKSNFERFAKSKAEQLEKLEKLARETGLSLIHFSLAWCLKNPNVSTVILGASKVAQLTENLRALEAVGKLTPDILRQIDEFMPVDSWL
jgi:aryl-alcohol dehydrogenase-like predicted oxidoreductase